MSKKEREVLKLSPIFFKAMLVMLIMTTTVGSFLAYVNAYVATKDELKQAQLLNQVQVDNIKTNYEFHIEQIYEDLREIRNMVKGE